MQALINQYGEIILAIAAFAVLSLLFKLIEKIDNL